MAVNGEGNGFFACYLLTPQKPPQRLRCSYVGFTVSPARRLRQHNGEIVSGAKRTTKYRPWDMVLVVHGFPSKFHALQFEYAWQHPFNSRFTKQRMSELKGQRGLGHPRSTRRKLIEVHEMLYLQPWTHFPLTLSYTSEVFHDLIQTNRDFYRWPDHMTCETKPLTEFVSVGKRSRNEDDDGDEDTPELCCFVCEQELADTTSDGQTLRCYHENCHVICHALCLADHFLSTLEMDEGPKEQGNRVTSLRPERGQCPDCQRDLHWALLVQHASSSCKKAVRKRRKKRKQSSDAEENSEKRTGDDHAMRQNAEAHDLPSELSGGNVEYDESSWFQEEDSEVVGTRGDAVCVPESGQEDCIDLTLEEED